MKKLKIFICLLLINSLVNGLPLKVLHSANNCLRSTILNLIFHEKKSVVCAMYSLKNKLIISALVNAHDRGVKVKIIADQASKENNLYLKRLEKRGIIDYYDNKRILMHNKFWVFGDDLAVTGSFNATDKAAKYCENVMIAEDRIAARDFLNCWSGIERDIKGIKEKNNKTLEAKETSLKVLYSAKNCLRSTILSLIFHEKKSVVCAMYLLKDNMIISELAHAHDRGVRVKVIVDKASKENSLYLKMLEKRGIIQYYERQGVLMHNKFWLFGDDLAVTGSFNATDKATRYCENIMIAEDQKATQEFLSCWNGLERDIKAVEEKNEKRLKEAEDLLKNRQCESV